MDVDELPWDVGWNKSLEREVADHEGAGDLYDNICSTIEDVLEDPVRVGKYKEGGLKCIRSTHVEHLVLGWEVTPGVNQPSMQDRVEEVYLHFLVHHDDMDLGLTNRDPAEQVTEYEICFPYFGGFVMQEVLNDFYELQGEVPGFTIDVDWQSEQVVATGKVTPDSRDEIEALVPDTAEVSFDSTSPF